MPGPGMRKVYHSHHIHILSLQPVTRLQIRERKAKLTRSDRGCVSKVRDWPQNVASVRRRAALPLESVRSTITLCDGLEDSSDSAAFCSSVIQEMSHTETRHPSRANMRA